MSKTMEMRFSLPKVAIPVVILGIAVIVTKANPFTYVTQPGNATVIFNSFKGLEKDRVEMPGITLITPIVERPVTYNVRTLVWEFTNSERSANRAGTAIAVNSADGQSFELDVYVALRPNEATLDDLHGEIGENYMNTVVVPVVRSKIRDISAEFNSSDFYRRERRTEIERRATELIRSEMPTTGQNGQEIPLILVEGMFLGTPNFPKGLKDSIERKQVASITAQTAAVRAEIQSKETERVLILAEANQQAIELKGQAAAANAKLADLLFFEKLSNRIEQAKTAGRSSPMRVIRIEGDSTVFLNLDPQKAAAVAPQ
ncbi:MAG: prohibitin family protein [Xenococcaceae cyanobacterium]